MIIIYFWKSRQQFMYILQTAIRINVSKILAYMCLASFRNNLSATLSVSRCQIIDIGLVPLWKVRRDMRISPATDFYLLRTSWRFLKYSATDFDLLWDSERFFKNLRRQIWRPTGLWEIFENIRQQIWRPTNLQEIFKISDDRFGCPASLQKFFKIFGDD